MIVISPYTPHNSNITIPHPNKTQTTYTNSCGKTTMIQALAAQTGRALVVQNLSLQTDGADLIGGYRPGKSGGVDRVCAILVCVCMCIHV